MASSELEEIVIPRRAFNPVYLPLLDDMTETQIIYGGSGSGKSFFLAQRAVRDLLQGDRNYLICRKVGKYIGKSVWLEIENVIRMWSLEGYFTFNKTERVITCSLNGRQAIFTGLDDPLKLKSIRAARGAITDIWLEEAYEFEARDIRELSKRQRGGSTETPKRFMLSFNPVLRNHWIFETYFENIGWADTQQEYRSDKLLILKTTYKDNHWMTEQDIQRLEAETDPYYFAVYTLGNFGILGHVIFTNWRVEDLSGMVDQFTERRAGLDFGFADDPAALLRCHYDRMRKTIYIYDELYETGLTNDVLASRVLDMIGEDLVTCDSSEPKSIQELRNEKVNARGARKGKDSVNFGIDWLKQQTLILDTSCINTRNELQAYKWKEDAGGHALKIPVDRQNHIIDALRYAFEDDAENVGSQVFL